MNLNFLKKNQLLNVFCKGNFGKQYTYRMFLEHLWHAFLIYVFRVQFFSLQEGLREVFCVESLRRSCGSDELSSLPTALNWEASIMLLIVDWNPLVNT